MLAIGCEAVVKKAGLIIQESRSDFIASKLAPTDYRFSMRAVSEPVSCVFYKGISLCNASHFSNERAARLGNWPVGLSR